MHSHDRTLLSNLGFADPDKGDKRHDLACQYLAIKENLRAILDHFYAASNKEQVSEDRFRGIRTIRFSDVEARHFESPICKGTGDYRSVVGFLDLKVRVTTDVSEDGERGELVPKNCNTYLEWVPFVNRFSGGGEFAFEVKINPVGIGAITRQIKLYREFISSCYGDVEWIVATVFPLSGEDRNTLQQSSIHCVRLGPKFEAWCEERAREKPSEADQDTLIL